MKRPVVYIITLIVLVFFSVTGADLPAWGQNTADEINAIYKKGIDAYKKKDYTAYLEIFKTLDNQLPNNRVVMGNLSRAYALNRKADDSLRYMKKLILIDADPQIIANSDYDSIRQTYGFKAIVKQIETTRKPISCSRVAFLIKERDLHTESIAYDPVKNTFYLSSVHKRKIVYIDKDGTTKDFTSQAQDGLDSVMGIRVDPKNRVLWVTSIALPNMVGYIEKDKGRTGVFAYHLDTKKLIKKYIMQEGGDHAFDDLAIHPGGDIYLSDMRGIYRIPVQTDRLEPFIGDPGFQSIEGIDFCDNGKKLLAADWMMGLYLVDVENKKVQVKVEAPSDISLIGIDGLYYQKETNSVIAIQNGINPARVTQYFLSPDFRRVIKYKIIERANALFNEPTLGVVVFPGEFYYIGNSQWKEYDKDSKIFPFERLQDIVIFKAVFSR